MRLFRRPVVDALASRKKITVLAETNELEGMQQFLSSRRMGRAVRTPDTGPYGLDAQPTVTLRKNQWQSLGERAVETLFLASELGYSDQEHQKIIGATAVYRLVERAVPQHEFADAA